MSDQPADAVWVTVRRDDLVWALQSMTMDGVYTDAVKQRLEAALRGDDDGD